MSLLTTNSIDSPFNKGSKRKLRSKQYLLAKKLNSNSESSKDIHSPLNNYSYTKKLSSIFKN